MKKYLYLFLIPLCMGLCMSMAACGSDDEKDDLGGGGGGSKTHALVGTWSMNYVLDGKTYKMTVKFNSNGTGNLKNAVQNTNFTWTATGTTSGIIEMGGGSLGGYWSYSINGNTLILEGQAYTRE
jgi:hypothetical protein